MLSAALPGKTHQVKPVQKGGNTQVPHGRTKDTGSLQQHSLWEIVNSPSTPLPTCNLHVFITLYRNCLCIHISCGILFPSQVWPLFFNSWAITILLNKIKWHYVPIRKLVALWYKNPQTTRLFIVPNLSLHACIHTWSADRTKQLY